VDLQSQIDRVTDGLTDGSHDRHSIADNLAGGLPLPLREKGCRAQRCIALLDALPGAVGALLQRVAGHVGEDADLVAHLTTQQLVDWFTHRLSEDVPQRNVNRAEGGAEHRATEVRVARHHLIMVFDA